MKSNKTLLDEIIEHKPVFLTNEVVVAPPTTKVQLSPVQVIQTLNKIANQIEDAQKILTGLTTANERVNEIDWREQTARLAGVARAMTANAEKLHW